MRSVSADARAATLLLLLSVASLVALSFVCTSAWAAEISPLATTVPPPVLRSVVSTTPISAVTVTKLAAVNRVPLCDNRANTYRWAYPAMAVDWGSGIAVVAILETPRAGGQTMRLLRGVNLKTGSILWTNREPIQSGATYGFVSPAIGGDWVWVGYQDYGTSTPWGVKPCSLQTGAWDGWFRNLPGADPVAMVAGPGYGLAAAVDTVYTYDVHGGQIRTAPLRTPIGRPTLTNTPDFAVTAGGELYWCNSGRFAGSFVHGANQAPPLVANGTGYVGGKDGLYSVDITVAGTGNVLWQARTARLIVSGLAGSTGLSRTSGMLYALSGDRAGVLTAFQAKDGALAWATPLPQVPRFVATPVVVNDVVLAMGEAIYAFSAASGQLLASYAPSSAGFVGLDVSPDKTRACALQTDGTLHILAPAP